MTWTKKYDEFALSCNLSESATYVLRDILRKGKLNDVAEIEIDLKKTNKWIGKHRIRGEYHRKTIINAMSQLDERSNGMVTIIKKYNPWVYKIMVRPLSFLEKIEGAKCASSLKLQTGQSMFEVDHKKRVSEQQQQDISKIKHLFGSLGLKYTEDAIYRLWRYAGKKVESVQKAVEYMLYCHGKKLEQSEHEEGITRPHGWLHDCLKYGRHIEAASYVDGGVELPYFGDRGAIPEFIDGITRLLTDEPRTV